MDSPISVGNLMAGSELRRLLELSLPLSYSREAPDTEWTELALACEGTAKCDDGARRMLSLIAAFV